MVQRLVGSENGNEHIQQVVPSQNLLRMGWKYKHKNNSTRNKYGKGFGFYLRGEEMVLT